MMNAPTKSAITANVSRKALKNPRFSLACAWLSAVSAAPERTSVFAGSTPRMRVTTSSSLTPGRATTRMASSRPGSPRTACAADGVNIVNEAPPGLSVSP